jgi:hypothetical protein
MREEEVSIYDSMLEINKLARRIEELSKPFSISREALAQVARDEEHKRYVANPDRAVRYAVGDTYAPRDGWYAGPFTRVDDAYDVTPPPGAGSAFFIWECRPGGGYVAVARWDNEDGEAWLITDDTVMGRLRWPEGKATPCS